MKNENIKLYRRDIDDLFECDAHGRKSRLFISPEKIIALGMQPPGPGRAIKLQVSPDFIEDPKLVRPMVLINTFYYYRGLAPRIYRTGMHGEYPYTEVEILKGPATNIEQTREKIIALANEVGWITPYEIDLDNKENYIADKFVDFHGFQMDMPKFYEWMSKVIANNTHWGRKDHNERFSYQDFDDVVGKRRIAERAFALALDKLDFAGKSVLDIGCNLGRLTATALNSGASRAVGVDLKPVIEAADYYRFYHDIKTELYAESLNPGSLMAYGPADIVLFLAMRQSLGIPHTLADITNEVLVYEGHEGESHSITHGELSRIFPKVYFVGYTNDRGKRPVFHCFKK